MLVAAVLAPERAQHAQFDRRQVAAEVVAGAAVLVAGERELRQRLVIDGDGRGIGDARARLISRAVAGHQPHHSIIDRQISRPSSPPSRASLDRSGWGIMPSTLPAALITPAMLAREPLGLASGVTRPAGSE